MRFGIFIQWSDYRTGHQQYYSHQSRFHFSNTCFINQLPFHNIVLSNPKRVWWEKYCLNGNWINEKNIAETKAGYGEIYCWNRSTIDKQNIAKLEADWGKYCWNGGGIDDRILVNEKLIFYLHRIVRYELSRRLVHRRIVRAELSCAELSGHRVYLCQLIFPDYLYVVALAKVICSL